MKILAIRGKNLTSLAGEFEIPFDKEPLASAGLFAISGPTGAGKSSLLDALCLALYDDTPRLLKAGGLGARLPDVAGETVSSHDSRTLLRRGSAEGYAEVDFAGNDGCLYRARWSVRRSRARSDGRLQTAEMSLKSLPALQSIGGVKSEVKTEIVRRIGLNFEQFTRSVLLAQNEFSLFLKADDNERGELLETLTGIVLYSAISRRAFERAKVEQINLDRYNDRLADQKPLPAEAREKLELDSSQANQVLLGLENQQQLLAGQLRWHEALLKMLHSESMAEAAWSRLQSENDAAASRHAFYALIVAVQPARALLADCDRLTAGKARSELAISQGQNDLLLATQALQAVQASQLQAQQTLLFAEQQQSDAQPELDRAKALDAQLQALAPLHQALCKQRVAASAAVAEASLALVDNHRQRSLQLEERQKAQAWLSQHCRIAKLAENWLRWDTLFVQATKMAQEQAGLIEVQQEAQQAELRLNQAALEADHRLEAALQAMTQAQAVLDAAQLKLDKFDVAARLLQKQSAEERRDRLLSAEQQWRDLAANLSTQARLLQELAQLQTVISEAESLLQQLAAPLVSANTALLQAEKSLKSAEAACAKSVESLRATLEPQVACPVCGSLEHPYQSGNLQLHAMLDSLQTEVTQTRSSVQQLQQQQTAQQTIALTSREHWQAVSRQSTSLAVTISMAQTAWHAQSLAVELADLAESQYPAWFAEKQQALKLQLQALAIEEKAEREAVQARDKAQALCNTASVTNMRCKDALAQAQSLHVKASTGRAASQEKIAEITGRIEGTLSELDAAFESQEWMEAWRSGPVAFHEGCKNGVRQWQAQSKLLEACEQQLGKLEVASGALQEALIKAEAQASRLITEEAGSAAQLEKMQQARQALFGGQKTTWIQEGLQAAIDSAKASKIAQDKFLQQKINQITRLQEALVQATMRYSQQSEEAIRFEATLSEWIAGFSGAETPLNIEKLRCLLGYQEDWINGEHNQLQALRSALQNASTVLQERRLQRELHQQSRPETDSVDAVKQALALLEHQSQTAQEVATGMQLAIAQDQTRRLKFAAVLAEMEKQEVICRRWAQLSELIGSADGKKFRNYAQQYTLDVLLGHANLHLRELSRRYRLQRINDTLALLVVDQDMGDELRSVHSLSGGESFLVSLALALGLASLSSNRVRVESLFIDEGFGSLDAETLAVAMDALDGLQAMGRKVGVISHVQEMTERISTQVLVQRMAGGKSQVVII